MSIVFDRAVEYYDQTRGLPEWRHRALIEALVTATNMQANDLVLEIGIGTGRIALSVAEHVNHLTGIDLSQEMMSVLRRKQADSHTVINLAQANAVQLPFADNTFDIAYAVHVYHLVHSWQEGIADAFRILKPEGYFVVSYHKRDSDSPNVRLRKQMHVFARVYGLDTKRPGAQSEQETFDEILKWDPNPRIAEAGAWRDNEVPAKILEELNRQIFSETWMIPRDIMDKIIPRLTEWAKQEYGDLSTPIELGYQSRWLVAQKSK